MKCPFRTITTTEQLYSKEGSVTKTDFMDCLGDECPYWGITVQQHRYTGGWETVTEPKCRKCQT